MSWESVTKNELDLDIDGVVKVTFTCPRCGHRQTEKIGGGVLVFGHEITCNNPVCGDREMYFELSLSVSGSQKGLSDVPLRTPNKGLNQTTKGGSKNRA